MIDSESGCTGHRDRMDVGFDAAHLAPTLAVIGECVTGAAANVEHRDAARHEGGGRRWRDPSVWRVRARWIVVGVEREELGGIEVHVEPAMAARCTSEQ
jgi:hypothetical protein